MSEIKPALTPEEWKGDLLKLPRYVTEADAPWLMAVANARLHDGDPRKFTGANVALLRVMVDEFESYSYLPPPNRPQAKTELRALAERIAALLPPDA